jgi:hypothetical protein
MATKKKGSSVLKKITTYAKKLRKKHPSAKWSSLVKQAGASYRSGKMGRRKKRHSAPKRKARRVTINVKVGSRRRSHRAKRKTARRVGKKKFILVDSATGEKRMLKANVAVARRKRHKTYKPVRVEHCRRVSGKKSNMTSMLLLGALGLGVVYLMTRPTVPALTPAAAAAGGSTLLQAAQAAGASATALIAIVNKLNTQPAAQTQSDTLTLNSTNTLPADYASIIQAGAAPSTSLLPLPAPASPSSQTLPDDDD